MSKSKKNVIDPNSLLDKYGADTTRFFCLFAAPPERDLEWSEQGVEGGFRFLNRVWRFVVQILDSVSGIAPFAGSAQSLGAESRELYKKIHQTIDKVTRDIEDRFHFNTAISAVMELFNLMSSTAYDPSDRTQAQVMRLALETHALLLAPIVPHFAEELWQALGYDRSVLLTPWPSYNEAALEKDTLLIVIQVNGKLRSRFEVSPEADSDTIKAMALADERVNKFIQGKPIKKVIVVKNKLVNIVI